MKESQNETDIIIAFIDLVQFVELVATPKRPDGTFNYCREALQQRAVETLTKIRKV
jgi:hypothetical protein